MAELIIGHTTHDSAMLWVRGDEKLPLARVTLKPQPTGDPISCDPLSLRRDGDYVGVASIFGRLQPHTPYRVVAEFASSPAALDRSPTVQCGQLHTFPEPGGAGSRFSFLLGSCNLSTARLTGIGGLAASALGAEAMSRSVERATSTWDWPKPTRDAGESLRGRLTKALKRLGWRALELRPGWSRWGLTKSAWALTAVVAQVTRFQQVQPMLPSPFEPLLGCLDGEPGERAAFMIHAGDQIYFDVDFPVRPVEVEEYRRAYRQAWFEDPCARDLLAQCPHYMILDDHEIVDGFANQPDRKVHLGPAMQAYREYVHARQPQESGDALYYRFRYDQARFFVLDTRTERSPAGGRMIGPDQMRALLGWLRENRDELKFVVSSVPFVAQLRPSAQTGETHETAGERRDKWCGEAFRRQRDEIIDCVHRDRIRRLVFLVGDMHCTYHATLRVGAPDERVVVHELAAGPIHQLHFTERKAFYDHYRGVTVGGVPFISLLRSFHGAAGAVLHVSVDPGSVLRWKVVPTSRHEADEGYQPPMLRGRISFPEIPR